MIQIALRLWQKDVNRSGGLLGRPVKLHLYDDRSDPALCRRLYQRLIQQDKVDLLVSPYGTPLTMVAAELTEPARYVLLAFAASGVELWQRGYRYVFGVYAPADRYFIGFMDLVARQGFRKVAIVFEDSSFNRSAARGARFWARRFGLKVVFYRTFPDRADALAQAIQAMARTGPDALVFSSYPPNAFRALKEMKRQAARPPAVAMAIAPALPDFYKKAGPLAEGVFGPSHWEPNARLPFPGSRRFVRAFREFSGGSMPSYHAASAYAAMKIIESAIRHFKTLNQDKLRQYVLALDTVTVVGRFKVDINGRQIGHSPFLIQWQHGVKQIVYPPKMQTASPVFTRRAKDR
jgi:branched-chain amino acid transport system substrate-binding protein